MLHLRFQYLKPDHVVAVQTWLRRAGTELLSDVRETLRLEGVRHELAYLLETSDGPVLVYAVECDDLEHAHAVFAASPRPVDHEHAAVMSAAVAGEVPARRLLDVTA